MPPTKHNHLPKNVADPEMFKHLTKSGIPWSIKTKILKTYRGASRRRSEYVRTAYDRPWILLLGSDFKRHRDCNHWNSIKRAHFYRFFYVKRRHVLNSIKKNSRKQEGTTSWFCDYASYQPRSSSINPRGAISSKKTEEVLKKDLSIV